MGESYSGESSTIQYILESSFIFLDTKYFATSTIYRNEFFISFKCSDTKLNGQ